MDATQVLFTWIQAGDCIGTDTRITRLEFLRDTMVNLRYNDATKVMVHTLLGPQESQEAATDRLIHFLSFLYPELKVVIT